jgi:hypothetical protein
MHVRKAPLLLSLMYARGGRLRNGACVQDDKLSDILCMQAARSAHFLVHGVARQHCVVLHATYHITPTQAVCTNTQQKHHQSPPHSSFHSGGTSWGGGTNGFAAL